MYNPQEFEQLIEKFYSKNLNKLEQKRFEEILSLNPEAAEEFSKLNRMQEALNAIKIDKHKPILHNLLPQKKTNKGLKKLLLKIAAGIAIPLTIGLSIYLTSSYYDSKMESSFNEVICSLGNEASVTLPDGSEVLLYSNSKLLYPSQFTKKERNVELEGEAIFKVTSNREYPFYVNNKDKSSRIMAYGTEFRVINYNDEKNLYVFLKNGKVDFISSKLDQNIKLTPGNELTYIKDTKQIYIHEASTKYNALDKGIYIYKEEPLDQLVIELNRRFNTKITIENQNLKNIKFTGTLKDETHSEIIQMITMSSPSVKWKKNKNLIILY